MNTRRTFLKTGLLGAGAMALGGPRLLAAEGRPPMRFIFMHKGNGLWPKALVPSNLSKEHAEAERRKDAFDADLTKCELPEWMSPVASHQSDMTILQGLSGKMCTTGHHTWCSSLGVFKANERLSSIKWATVDFELANLFPSPFGHIELACFPTGGGNSRGNANGIEKGFSARGPQQPNYAFGSPKIALRELFQSVSSDEAERARYELERRMLAFVARKEGGLTEGLEGLERVKVANYAESVEAIRERNRRIEAMGDAIRRNLPKLDDDYLADNVSTIDRQRGFTEILLSTLISGMTNVVTFTVDELGTPYTGVSEIENENINLHDVGHGKPVARFDAEQVRAKVRRHHMELIDVIVNRLKSVPEGDGSMFDNTMLFYFPDNGETHHSSGVEWPFVLFSGSNARVDLRGRYIRLPGYGQEGHRTLGNWYTTILNAHGNPIEHYGALDPGLNRFGLDQTGPIPQFLQAS